MKASALKSFWMDEQGQDLVEYALLLAFIAIAATATLTTFKEAVEGVFTRVSTKLNAAAPTT